METTVEYHTGSTESWPAISDVLYEKDNKVHRKERSNSMLGVHSSMCTHAKARDGMIPVLNLMIFYLRDLSITVTSWQ